MLPGCCQECPVLQSFAAARLPEHKMFPDLGPPFEVPGVLAVQREPPGILRRMQRKAQLKGSSQGARSMQLELGTAVGCPVSGFHGLQDWSRQFVSCSMGGATPGEVCSGGCPSRGFKSRGFTPDTCGEGPGRVQWHSEAFLVHPSLAKRINPVLRHSKFGLWHTMTPTFTISAVQSRRSRMASSQHRRPSQAQRPGHGEAGQALGAYHPVNGTHGNITSNEKL